MEPFKLRMKIGQHEFEAEGDQESVERQFTTWRDLIAASGSSSPQTLGSPPPGEEGPPVPPPAPRQLPYDRIFRKDGEVVSLTILPPAGEEQVPRAALLILLGRREYAQEDLVTGGRLLQGLGQSGLDVDRADRMFGEFMPQYVIRSGQHRAVRYRLTNPGLTRARQIAEELLAMVP
jgi:hypothetical protein